MKQLSSIVGGVLACNKGSEAPTTEVGMAYKVGVNLDQEVSKLDDGRLPPVVCSYCTCTALMLTYYVLHISLNTKPQCIYIYALCIFALFMYSEAQHKTING